VNETGVRVTRPAVLNSSHDLTKFDCGEADLDDWLRKRALQNLHLNASRTYVACRPDTLEVVAYYALAMGSLLNREATGSMRRNMPAVVIGRLAVTRGFQGTGLGGAILQDAVLRSKRAAIEVSARLVIVHALTPAAEAFYLRHGFIRLPVETPTLALDLNKLADLG
jgi:GNAT superfamily N-acetyltransferase